jgi:hypothetical protein
VVLLGALGGVFAGWHWISSGESAMRTAVTHGPDVSPNVVQTTVPRYEPRENEALAGEEFSLTRYEQDRAAYLSAVVPGRAFRYLDPKPGVIAIRAASELDREIEVEQSVDLAVQALPRAPVTFTSVGSGQFTNRRNSITLEADEKGFARARFTATRGTAGTVPIYAACPMMTGQVAFSVYVAVPVPEEARQAEQREVLEPLGRNEASR